MSVNAIGRAPFRLATLPSMRQHYMARHSRRSLTLFLWAVLSLFLLANLSWQRTTKELSLRGLLRWWTPYYFSDTPPSWLKAYSKDERHPLVFRMAIITRPGEQDKRMAMRRSILHGVPEHDVRLTYKFFVGLPSKSGEFYELAPREPGTEEAVREEAHRWGDMEILDLGEGPLYMGEKRWMMLQWAASSDPSTYDFYLSADTDSFLRLAAMARRFYHLRPNTNPRTHSILWGHMLDHRRHWMYVPGNRSMEDPWQDGTPYRYPAGMAFLLSSALVGRLTSPRVELARHIKYNLDDVMHGMWTADHAPGTDILDDPAGFHDPPPSQRGWKPVRPIDYEAVCVHHISPEGMAELRARPEYARTQEWKES
jgi:hypothetical protein